MSDRTRAILIIAAAWLAFGGMASGDQPRSIDPSWRMTWPADYWTAANVEKMSAAKRARLNEAMRQDWRVNPRYKDWKQRYNGDRPPMCEYERRDPIGEYMDHQRRRAEYERIYGTGRQRARIK